MPRLLWCFLLGLLFQGLPGPPLAWGVHVGVAWAEGSREEKGSRREGEKNGKRTKKGKESPEEDREYDEGYTYYGQIYLNGPQGIRVGSRLLLGEPPLAPYLAPGMWVEVRGRVEGPGLQASALRVLWPRRWAYYRGPGLGVLEGEGWVEAWFDEGRLFRYQKAQGNQVQPLALMEGAGRGFPRGLAPR